MGLKQLCRYNILLYEVFVGQAYNDGAYIWMENYS